MKIKLFSHAVCLNPNENLIGLEQSELLENTDCNELPDNPTLPDALRSGGLLP